MYILYRRYLPVKEPIDFMNTTYLPMKESTSWLYYQLIRVTKWGDCTRVVSHTFPLPQFSQLSKHFYLSTTTSLSEHLGHINALVPSISYFSCSMTNASDLTINGCHHPPASLFAGHHPPKNRASERPHNASSKWACYVTTFDNRHLLQAHGVVVSDIAMPYCCSTLGTSYYSSSN